MQNNPRILVFDIETSPINVDVWALGKQHITIDQIKQDWSILSFAAKWLGEKKIYYYDTRKEKDPRNDKKVVAALWKLLDEADLVVAHNGDKFDIKKFNYRAAFYGMEPPSHYKSTDTYKETKRVFGSTSHKLSYLTDKFNKKYKKLKHNKYPGRELWTQVLTHNTSAWKEMEKYNKYDILSTEEFLTGIRPWIKMHNLSAFITDDVIRCPFCLSSDIRKAGPVRLASGIFQGYRCSNCKKRPHGRVNLLHPETKRRRLR